MSTHPTDAEIDLLVSAFLGNCGPQATRVYDYTRAVLALWGSPPPKGEPVAWNGLTDEDRERAMNSMPGMLEGFTKTWGWLHFAKAIEAICREKNAQPAPAYKDSTPELHVGDSAFESWYSAYNPAHKGDKQRAHDAYVAGMGDRQVTAAPAAVAGPSEFPHEQMDALALARYKVVPSHESMFHRHAVVAGDGSQQLYIGREVECENIARKFAGAFLDGAFAFHSMLAAAPTPPAQTADSVTAPAAGAVAHTISDAQIEAMPVWRNFVGLWPESRREIVDAVVDLFAAAPTPPTQAAAPARAIGPCVICGSDEPFTGTCGGGDSRALCKQPAPQQEARPVTPYTCPKCSALWLHWPAEQSGFGMDTLNCRSTTHCDYCEKGGVEQLQRLERVPAVLAAPQPSPTPQADSGAAPSQQVIVDFAQVGTAGPFAVVDGRVSLPDATMQDLVHMLRPTFNAQAADSVLEDAASAGFFLRLPQRPKPEAPAGTVGLDWDAYSGAQMLAYGRDCSNAAIVATQNPAQPAPSGDALDAARYRYLRDVPMELWPAELMSAIRLQQNAKWDAAIDAAIAAQGSY